MSNELIKKVFMNDPMQLLDESFSDLEIDYTDEYVGQIMDNNDPDKKGRCRVNVFGIFDSIDKDLLPWAVPDFSFVGSSVGSFIVPPNGCMVRIRFDKGNVNYPIYSSKVIDFNNLPKNHGKNYPNNMIFFETNKGTSFEIDREKDDILFTHKSGTKVKFSIDGDSGKVSIDVDEVEIKATGKTTFSGTRVEMKHSGIWSDNGRVVVPDPAGGPYCAILTCPYSGLPHQGNMIQGSGAFIPAPVDANFEELTDANAPEVDKSIFMSSPAEIEELVGASEVPEEPAETPQEASSPILAANQQYQGEKSDTGEAQGKWITEQMIKAAFPKNKYPAELAKSLNNILPKYQINTKKRVWAFLAQCGHESAGFTVMSENLNYSAKGLMKTFSSPKYYGGNEALANAHAKKPMMIASYVYRNRMGNGDEASKDGYKYRGRGYIQLTGKENYTNFAKSIGLTIDEAVAYCETVDGAVESACWFWNTRKLNNIADQINTSSDLAFTTLTKRINGGTIGLEARKQEYDGTPPDKLSAVVAFKDLA